MQSRTVRLPQTVEEAPSFLRQLLYDATRDGCVAAEIIGLMPVTPDQAHLEHRASAERIGAVRPLIEHIEGMTGWLASYYSVQILAQYPHLQGEMDMCLLQFILEGILAATTVGVMSMLTAAEAVKVQGD